MEFADMLVEWKCGGPREDDCPDYPIVKIGYKYRWEEYAEDKGILTVNAENIKWVRRVVRSQRVGEINDIDYLTRVDGEQKWAYTPDAEEEE